MNEKKPGLGFARAHCPNRIKFFRLPDIRCFFFDNEIRWKMAGTIPNSSVTGYPVQTMHRKASPPRDPFQTFLNMNFAERKHYPAMY